MRDGGDGPDTFDSGPVPVQLAGIPLEPRHSGALWWPARHLLVVADLHLGKAAAIRRRGGSFLPPYDDATTLDRLAAEIRALAPAAVLSLGDAFHTPDSAAHMAACDRARLDALATGHPWTWITGNHDPLPPGLPGVVAEAVTLDRLVFRHEASPAAPLPGHAEISGHFHPKLRLPTRGRRIAGRCFVADRRRLILPAFGAFTGGLDIADPAIAGLLVAPVTCHLIGRSRLHRIPLG